MDTILHTNIKNQSTKGRYAVIHFLIPVVQKLAQGRFVQGQNHSCPIKIPLPISEYWVV